MTSSVLLLALLQQGKPTPTVLIQPVVRLEGRFAVSSASISDYFAEAVDKDGRLKPIVASQSDPVFRDWVDEGRVPNYTPPYNEEQMVNLQRIFGLEYLALISAKNAKDKIEITLEVRQRGRTIFKEGIVPGTVTIAGKEDYFAEVRNGVNTLYASLVKTTLGGKSASQPKLPEVKTEGPKVQPPKNSTPPPTKDPLPTKDPVKSPSKEPAKQPEKEPTKDPSKDPVKEPVKDPVPQEIKPEPAKETPLSRAKSMIAIGQFDKAIPLLRDAIDLNPISPELRQTLIEALIGAKEYELAAQEAKHAQELMPSQTIFKELSAKAWMLAGKNENARTELSEAAVKNPKERNTRVLLARVALVEGQFAVAEGLCTPLLSEKMETKLLAYRFLSRVGLADPEASNTDFTGLKSQQTGLGQLWNDLGEPIGSTLTQLSVSLRALIQRAVINRSDPSVPNLLKNLGGSIDQMQEFQILLSKGQKSSKSLARRQLALKLLSESLTGLVQYIGGGDSETLSDCRISLGEGIRQLNLAKEEWKQESGR